MTAFRWHILLTAIVWISLAAMLLALLDTLKSGCQLQESDSGLWAECFAPSAVIFTGIFAAIFVADLVRTILAILRFRAIES